MDSGVHYEQANKAHDTFVTGNGVDSHCFEDFHAPHPGPHAFISPDTVGDGERMGVRMFCLEPAQDHIQGFVGKPVPGVTWHARYPYD